MSQCPCWYKVQTVPGVIISPYLCIQPVALRSEFLMLVFIRHRHLSFDKMSPVRAPTPVLMFCAGETLHKDLG